MTTILRALIVLALIAAASFGVEAALPRAGRAKIVASHALGRLLAVRADTAVEHVAGVPPLRTTCASRWLGHGHASVATLGRNLRVRVINHRLLFEPPASAGTLAFRAFEFELAACPNALGGWIGSDLNRGLHVAIANVRNDGDLSYRLTFPTAPQLVVYVDRRRLRLLSVAVRGRHWVGWSDVRLDHRD